MEEYLARIAAYDQNGPALNSIVVLNPHALLDADRLDQERKSRGPRGPLHGIPVLLKDNYDTMDMPTSGGTLALARMQPTADAFQAKRLREAGAIILGKATMHELAAGVTTVSSLTGYTLNPYDLARVPGGSSGGPAVAVAASFCAAAMGSDTAGSIRIPAAFQNLVGLRTTRGLASRSGVMPLSSTQDVAAPLARTVSDLAIMLDATVLLGKNGRSGEVEFTYEAITGRLDYRAKTHDLKAADVIGMTLQHGTSDKPGPVIWNLLKQCQSAANKSFVLRGADREDLIAGKLYVQLYTSDAPLGIGRQIVRMPTGTPNRLP
ncbi:MAG: amidase [Holophaga sp.]|nr:amidase [Holophaga sp.]